MSDNKQIFIVGEDNQIVPNIMKLESYVDLSEGRQIYVLINPKSNTFYSARGSVTVGVRTPAGVQGLPIEFEIIVDKTKKDGTDVVSVMDHVEAAFEKFDEAAHNAVEEKKAELEGRNKIVPASGAPFDLRNIKNDGDNKDILKKFGL